jgi:hypothetical protein
VVAIGLVAATLAACGRDETPVSDPLPAGSSAGGIGDWQERRDNRDTMPADQKPSAVGDDNSGSPSASPGPMTPPQNRFLPKQPPAPASKPGEQPAPSPPPEIPK